MANRKLRITEEAYKTLLNYKLPHETISDCILRRYSKKSSVKNFLRDNGAKVETY